MNCRPDRLVEFGRWGSGLEVSPSSVSGRPDRLAFSRCSTARLLRMRRARATKGAEWSSSGVLRASRYCRQLVCRIQGTARTEPLPSQQ